jgi:serine phosphatase RsbU (regulator of sigma subunit)
MAAENMIGRRRDDLLGRSFWDVFPEVLGTRTETLYRRAMTTDVMTQFDVHYGRLDKYFEARVFPTPDGVSVHFSDVGSQRRAEVERDRANARVAVLDRIGEAVAETLDVDEALSRLADTLVPGIATLVTIDLRATGENRNGGAVIAVGSSVDEVTAMREAEAIHPRRLNPRSAVYRVIHGGAPTLIHDPLKHLGPTLPVSEEQLAHWLKVPIRSAIVVPLVGRGRILGAITLMRTRTGQPLYTDDDLTLAIEIGRRAGVMIDNAAQYTTQRKLAETLQRSLLPELPAVPGIELAAHYEPSSAEAKVGGDWYDAFPLPGSGLGLVIGDVMGHDMQAATAMGQLRSVVRTCAVDGDPPSEVLDRLDRLVDSFAMADLATVVYARLDRHPDGSATMVYANAGHPPPLLVTADGRTRFLREASSTMIGAPGAGSHAEAVVHLPPGAIVLMFTDGLVERRRTDLGERLEVFRHVTEAMWEAHTEIQGFAAGIMTEMQRDSESDDDAALLAIRVRP